ncbi:MAG TPA: zf-HC2 domain-containing protein [Chthonomonadaceae bacterium]|nr:zf-HC2 domain-containing protein [Chthonomonadaceae bacterium]
MQCQQARELFSDYVAESMENALAVSLENHLAVCTACREEVAGLRRVWAALEQAPLIEPPMFLHENIMHRLDAARAEAEEAAARKRAVWDWRALFRPRALAYGAAAVVLMLAGVEAVQTQRASLGPVGWVIQRFVHPAEAETAVTLQATRAEWMPGTEGGGTLVVHLRPASPVAPGANLTYRAQLAGYREAVAQGTLAAEGETAVTLTLPEMPKGETLQLSVRLTGPNGEMLSMQRLPLSLPAPASNGAPLTPQ